MTTEVIYCARHPSVETGLRCGRCDTPICPKCAVFTDVGARCPDCAPRRKLPQMELGVVWVLRAVAAAAVAGAVTGVIWGALLPNAIGFFSLAIGAAIGYCVGEGVSIATNRKVGTPLQVIAGLGVILAYFVHGITEAGIVFTWIGLWDLLAIAVGMLVATGRLRF